MKKAAAAAINTIWIITREYGTLAGAGGVKDVTRQLAGALARSGHCVSVALPLYGCMDPEPLGFSRLDLTFDLDMSYPQEERREFVTVWHQKSEIDIYLIDSPRFREKTGIYTYTAQDERHNPSHRQGEGHYDYFAMNVLLQKAALCLMIRLGQRPDIIHCHDGHTALLPAFVRELDGFRHYFRDTGFVVTIHNAGIGYHQEIYDLPFAQVMTGLPVRVIEDNLLDKAFDPFLAASAYAVMNTVSENYARELRETDDDLLTGGLGHTLQDRGVLLQGVTNGIDPADFDLKHYADLGLAAGFQPGVVVKPPPPSRPHSGGGELRKAPVQGGKALCREALCAAISERSLTTVRQNGEIVSRPDQALFTFIGRLSTQKGVDKMIEALKYLLPIDPDFQILIMGNGPKEIEEPLIAMTQDHRYQGRVCLLRGFDPIMANQVYAAGDFFLIPSRYEPCGLTDFIAQLFGNLPIVHHVGGLVKVVDGETGFAFHQHSGMALAETMQRALAIFRSSPSVIAGMQRAAVALIHERYTWDKVKDRYLKLYDTARENR
jgi:starch synthase